MYQNCQKIAFSMNYNSENHFNDTKQENSHYLFK